MISYVNSPDAVAVINAIDISANTKKYWNIFITEKKVVFILNEELYRSLLWRMIPEARRKLIENAPTLDELIPLDARNFSVEIADIKRLYIKEGGVFLRPSFHMEMKNGEHAKWILFTRNRRENFQHLKGIKLLNGEIELEII